MRRLRLRVYIQCIECNEKEVVLLNAMAYTVNVQFSIMNLSLETSHSSLRSVDQQRMFTIFSQVDRGCGRYGTTDGLMGVWEIGDNRWRCKIGAMDEDAENEDGDEEKRWR